MCLLLLWWPRRRADWIVLMEPDQPWWGPTGDSRLPCTEGNVTHKVNASVDARQHWNITNLQRQSRRPGPAFGGSMGVRALTSWRMSRMPTRKDVAERAGVSEATVSYALSGKRTISQATRERVFEAMRELDYRPNLMAQALAGGSSSIIALLFPSQERGISNADLEYVLGAASAARELGYHLLLWPTEDRDVSDVASLYQAGLIGGVLLMEVRMKDERLRTLGKAGVPVGLIGGPRLPSSHAQGHRVPRRSRPHTHRLPVRPSAQHRPQAWRTRAGRERLPIGT
jgi:transcriptional regulator with XRE-family HTH domain